MRRLVRRIYPAAQLAAPALLADAWGASVAAIVGVLTSLPAQIDSLHATLSKHLSSARTLEILGSLPGPASSSAPGCSVRSGMPRTAVAMLGLSRTPRGTAPITRASGERRTVLARLCATGAWPTRLSGGVAQAESPVSGSAVYGTAVTVAVVPVAVTSRMACRQ
jgi:hypothetical protein